MDIYAKPPSIYTKAPSSSSEYASKPMIDKISVNEIKGIKLNWRL